MFTIVQASTDLLAWKAMGHVIHTRGHEHENLPLEESACHTILHLCGREYYRMSRKGKGCSHAGKVHGGIEQDGVQDWENCHQTGQDGTR